MSDVPVTISRAKSTVPGENYEALRAEFISLVQRMSHEIWTDFNYSDPGVTILEQLCYALTDLPYRASLPVRDLLSAPHAHRIDLKRHGLFPAWSILPCNPVTANDLRRLILDRVPGVANVWFKRVSPKQARGVSGLYDVAILPRRDDSEQPQGDCCDDDDRLIERVLRCYGGHRALCEDVRNVRVLDLIDTVIHADVQVEDGADPSTALANALFRLGLFLAPEPKRMSLAEEIAVNAATDQVFGGPMMRRGFIADDQLTPLPREVKVNDLIEMLAATRGILSVDRLTVEIGGDPHRYGPDETLPPQPDGAFWLRGTTRENHFSIHLRHNDTKVQPNPSQVRRLLDRLWNEQRRTYPLHAEYDQRYGPPLANYLDLSTYTSVQTQFPNVYGIGRNGLPPGSSVARKAQAKQLKGYLMPFDQMMADYFSQLALIRDLFSIQAGGDATYAWQSLEPIVPDIDHLLKDDYSEGMAALTAQSDPVAARRNAILDLLLSLYAYEVKEPDQAMRHPGSTVEHAATLIRTKQAMLRRIAVTTRNRGRGLDYRRPRSVRGLTGVEMRSRIELEMLDAFTAADGTNPPSGHRNDRVWTASNDPADADFGKRLPDEIAPSLDRLFKPVDPFDEAITEAPAGASPLAGHRVAEPLADALADPSRYRIGRMEGPVTVYVVCIDTEGGWWWLGEHVDERRAIEAIRLLTHDSRHHRRPDHRPKLYIVEWILLRFAMLANAEQGGRYDFRITAVVSATRDEWQDKAWRRQAETILRQNTPAHVALDCLFLDPGEMRRFERLHGDWIDALGHSHGGRQVEASRALGDFLDGMTPAPTPNPTPNPTPGPTPGPTPYPTPSPTPDPSPYPTPEPSYPPYPTPEPPPYPTPCPTPEPSPCPTPEPTPYPLPTPTPEPEPEPDPHPIRDWLKWFWTTWFWPIVLLIITWKWRRKPSPAPTPPPSPTPMPVSSLPTPPPPTPVPTMPTPTPTPAPTPRPTPTPTATSSGDVLVAAAPSGATGFDCNTVLTTSTAQSFVDAGFSFAVRYVPRNFVVSDDSAQGNLTTREAEDILGSGLALMVVQHVAASPWTPSGSLGQSYGQYAVANAQAIGLPAGISLFLDLEGVAAGTSAESVSDYCGSWYDVVAAAGYVPGIYIGANCGLGASQIEALPFRYFWESGSNVPAISPGYCMKQSISSSYVLAGVAYDLDVIQADANGHTPFWLKADLAP